MPIDLIQWIADVAIATFKHGLSPLTFIIAVTALFRVEIVRRPIRKRYPWLFARNSEVKEYINNQHMIMENQRLMMEHLGVRGCVERNDSLINSEKRLSRLSIKEKLFAQIADVFTARESTTYSRRHKQMKTLLQKYTSTKLQALIVATIMNLALLVGYVLDVQDIQSKVAAWTPMANLIVQTILTIAYQWARASVDKAELKANSPEVSLYDAKSLDSVRSDSEDVGHTASN